MKMILFVQEVFVSVALGVHLFSIICLIDSLTHLIPSCSVDSYLYCPNCLKPADTTGTKYSIINH